MISQTAPWFVLSLAILAAPGCVHRSGRLDPFPAKIGRLHPSAPTVGVLRFTDKRGHPDWMADRLRSLPPPRVFFEEAALVAIQREGMNGIILTSAPEILPNEVAALAAGIRLDAVLAGEVTQCDQTLDSSLFGWNNSVRISCTIDFVLRDPRGKVLYSSSSHGEGSFHLVLNSTPDQIHQAFFDVVEKATYKRIDHVFGETVRRSVREAEGRKP